MAPYTCILLVILACFYTYTHETDFDIRLSGGSEPNVGRVEVYYSGSWGSVCDYNWDYRDANVTCRMLGYSTGHHLYRTTRYGSLTEPVWMTNVDCDGTEDSLADCSFDGWGQVSNCTIYPASVFCYNVTETKFNIRLSGGPEPNVGRVEVFYSGYWGGICNDDEWDYRDAIVTCRMLGYSTGYDMYDTSYYGRLINPVWMANVDCYGTEDSLADCSFDGWGRVGYCSIYPASVFCYNVTGEDIEVRLSGGTVPNIGWVEVFYSNYWGTICYKDWNHRNTIVTCRMLGYSTGHPIYLSSSYGQLRDPVWMAGVDCNGTEDSLADCSFDGWGQVGECFIYPATVFCYNVTAGSTIGVRLVDGPNNYSGQVEVFYSGYWGIVCVNNFDDRDAAVVCRMLENSDDQAILLELSGSYRPTWIDNLRCDGTETSLADCSFDGWGNVGYCYQAYVTCYNKSGISKYASFA